MNCPGCYKKSEGGYCLPCRKNLFDGTKVSPILAFDPPKADVKIYQEKTKRLSISGVQLKYSLKLNGKVLDFTEENGEYILKPIPAANFLANIDQVPENEHLTMQIASQIFGIKTAANAVIYFNEGTPAYITRRFDRKPDGAKYLQEDMAQLSGRSRLNNGENFKYEGSYEDIGLLIRKYVAAAQPVLENYFRLVLFNYIFSNGDAHLKNFSLLQTEMNDYALSPAYDLLSSVLHTPGEYDTALDLYDNDMDGEFYKTYGYYGQPEFRELAVKIGILGVRTERIISQMLSNSDEVIKMIDNSFLDERTKEQYKQAYKDKLQRLGKTKSILGSFIDPKHPGVYATTERAIELSFLDGTKKIGHFENRQDSIELEKDNKYTFIELANKEKANYSVVNGDEITSIKFIDN